MKEPAKKPCEWEHEEASVVQTQHHEGKQKKSNESNGMARTQYLQKGRDVIANTEGNAHMQPSTIHRKL